LKARAFFSTRDDATYVFSKSQYDRMKVDFEECKDEIIPFTLNDEDEGFFKTSSVEKNHKYYYSCYIAQFMLDRVSNPSDENVGCLQNAGELDDEKSSEVSILSAGTPSVMSMSDVERQAKIDHFNLLPVKSSEGVQKHSPENPVKSFKMEDKEVFAMQPDEEAQRPQLVVVPDSNKLDSKYPILVGQEVSHEAIDYLTQKYLGIELTKEEIKLLPGMIVYTGDRRIGQNLRVEILAGHIALTTIGVKMRHYILSKYHYLTLMLFSALLVTTAVTSTFFMLDLVIYISIVLSTYFELSKAKHVSALYLIPVLLNSVNILPVIVSIAFSFALAECKFIKEFELTYSSYLLSMILGDCAGGTDDVVMPSLIKSYALNKRNFPLPADQLQIIDDTCMVAEASCQSNEIFTCAMGIQKDS